MTIDPARCPICNEPNACAIASGRGVCWCFETRVPETVLDKVAPESRGQACVCRACADGTTTERDRRRAALRWVRR